MLELQNRIKAEGRVYPGGIIKVDGFLNHRVDTVLVDRMGYEFYNFFKDEKVTKVLTIEASGIAPAFMTARYFNVPMVFAKKGESKNLSSNHYSAEIFSYTKNRPYTINVDKNYITKDDNVLIIDDFLANGNAVAGLTEIIRVAGAKLAGVGICIEKGFQTGGARLRDAGIKLLSLAVVDVDGDGNITFV